MVTGLHTWYLKSWINSIWWSPCCHCGPLLLLLIHPDDSISYRIMALVFGGWFHWEEVYLLQSGSWLSCMWRKFELDTLTRYLVAFTGVRGSVVKRPIFEALYPLPFAKMAKYTKQFYPCMVCHKHHLAGFWRFLTAQAHRIHFKTIPIHSTTIFICLWYFCETSTEIVIFLNSRCGYSTKRMSALEKRLFNYDGGLRSILLNIWNTNTTPINRTSSTYLTNVAD